MILGSMTLAGLHEAIHAAMGWEGSHLHTFEIGGRYYGDPDSVDDVINEEQLTMNTVVKSGGRRFNYTYDFGDNCNMRSWLREKSHRSMAAATPLALPESGIARLKIAGAAGVTRSWSPC
jgi:hypothetical protein